MIINSHDNLPHMCVLYNGWKLWAYNYDCQWAMRRENVKEDGRGS